MIHGMWGGAWYWENYKKFLIIIPWQETYSDNLPKELTITS